MTTRWEPYREPLRATLRRTGGIALTIAAALSLWRGGIARLPANILLALWPAFGGHWIELWFLNWLRPRLPAGRMVQVIARLGTWFVGGIVLWMGVKWTAIGLAGGPHPAPRWPAWWIGGPVYIAIELVAHLVLQLRGKPSFYDGRG
jgi:hypothetical protein